MISRSSARGITLAALVAATIGGLVAAFLLVPIALYSMLAVVAVECAVVKGLGLIGVLSPVIVFVVLYLAWRAWATWSRRTAIKAALILFGFSGLAGVLTLIGPAIC
jgi:hypothetical protein